MKLACVRALAELARGRAVGRGGGRLRHARAALRARLPDPAPVRPAADHQSRPPSPKAAMDERRGDATDRGPRGLSRARCSGSSTSPARSCSRCSPPRRRRGTRRRLRRGRGRARAAARRRSRSTRSSPRPILIGRPDAIAAASGASACASRPAATSRSSTPTTTRCRDCGETYYRLGRRKGVDARRRGGRDAPQRTLIARHADARGRGRRHAVRHLRRAIATICATSPT